MTSKEMQTILIDSLAHTDETRVEYFINTAIKHNIKASTFSKALYEAYKELKNFVESSDYISWSIDENTGKKEYHKRVINLFNYHLVLPISMLDCNSIQLLKPSLIEYCEMVINDEKQKLKALVDSKNETINIDKASPNNTFKYIKSSQKDHVEVICTQLKTLGFISEKTKLTDFKKLFNESNIKDITKINWEKSIASLNYFTKKLPFENKFNIIQLCFTHNDKVLSNSQLENNKQVSKNDKNAIDNLFKYYRWVE